MNGLTRRDFLQAFGGLAVLGIPRRMQASPADAVCISLIHTTDLHGHIRPTRTYGGEENIGGLARCATQIAAWRKENPNHLLLDIGDVYQGTVVGHETRGRVMISCLNHLNYDAWVVGNHEFDWGFETFARATRDSSMPVLAANGFYGGRELDTGGTLPEPLERMAPWIIREAGGFRIAVIGLTTPGLPDWFPKATLGGFAATDPVDAVRRAMAALEAEKPDAIVLAAHMGTRPKGDNFANRIASLAAEFPKIALIIGGHTHRDVPAEVLGTVPYTQAGYFGICVGRADLIFDRQKRFLIDVQTTTRRMDAGIVEDPAILSLSAKDLKNANRILFTKVGRLKDSLEGVRRRGEPNETEILIGSAIREGLQKRSVQIDGVFHGTFQDDAGISAGDKTMRDMWRIIPFENETVTAAFLPGELRIVMEEVLSGLASDQRSLMGFQLKTRRQGHLWKVDAVVDLNGQPLDPQRKVVIALNSYDSASGGRRFHRLAEFLRRPETGTRLHSLQTREALIEFFAARREVGRENLKPFLQSKPS